MKTQNRYRIILYSLLGLLFILSSTRIATAQSSVHGSEQQRRSTQLTAQSAFVTDDDNTIITLNLTGSDGTPIADVPLLIAGDHLTTTQVATNENGEARWQLPPALPHGNHVWKVVFAGTDELLPAIAVVKLTLQPSAASPATDDAPAAKQQPSNALPNQPQLTDSPKDATEVVEHPLATATQTSNSNAIAISQVIIPQARLAKPIVTTIRPAAQSPWRSSWQWLLPQSSTLLSLIMHQLDATKPMQSPATLGLLGLIGIVLPAGYLTRRRFTSKARQVDSVSSVAAVPSADRAWRLPLPLWYGLRLLSVGFAIGIAVILFARPTVGLRLFWKLLIPLLPLLFFVAPGLWRNICPMAALNQAPRLFHFTQAWTVPKWFQRYGYLIGVGLFLTLVASRKVIFNQNGSALAILILCALSAAFLMGLFFKGKSGWCSSICPLLPVQRIYGQTPFVTVTHAHCEPCLGCTKNCYDLSPRNAYLADLYDEEPNFAYVRKAFVGFFPGFVLAFYLVPNPPAIAIWQVYALLALSGTVTLGALFLLENTAKALSRQVTSNKITVYFGALALNLYYWFNAPTLGSWIAIPAPDWFVWPLRTVVLGLTLFWIYRTYRKEAGFIEFTLTPVTIHGDQGTATGQLIPLPTNGNGNPQSPNAKPRLTIAPEGTCLTVDKNRTLLELCEQHNLPIEAGCRMGLCGADPVCVLDGMNNLSKISDEERKTLERLGLAPNTRMACMARVRGDVKVALTPERPDIYRSSIITGFRYDKQVQRVVIIGNGIAGVTAADHIRRRHPHCEIHLIGRERYHLYNRMGITRLIYGRSAMQGLMLLPEQWYEDFNITCWLNTQVKQIDAEAKWVTLGTGETLPYDRLILTTGSQSYVPPLAGYGTAGSFVLRTAEDAMAIRAYVQNNACRHAVIAGGGLLGLEAAYGLHKLGLTVTVLERSDALLTRQLDKRGSEHLLAHLTALGIQVLVQAEAASLQSSTEESVPDQTARLQQVTLADGTTLPCDLILVAAGIRPELELARSIGLSIQRGVVVDAQMRTSDPHVFAAGDVAEFKGNLYGLWPVSVSQAEVAAANAVAETDVVAAAYVETAPVTMLKVVGVDLTSIGRINSASPEEIVIVQEDEEAHCYRKLLIADNKIVGAILLGYPDEAPGVTAAVKEAVDITPHLAALQAGDWTTLLALA